MGVKASKLRVGLFNELFEISPLIDGHVPPVKIDASRVKLALSEHVENLAQLVLLLVAQRVPWVFKGWFHCVLRFCSDVQTFFQGGKHLVIDPVLIRKLLTLLFCEVVIGIEQLVEHPSLVVVGVSCGSIRDLSI